MKRSQMDVRRRHAFVRCITSIAVLALAGCALMARPQPATHLQLQLPEHWQFEANDLSISSVRAQSWLSTEQLLVRHGARLMQYKNWRWVATPETMLSEQLEVAAAQRKSVSSQADSAARIDLVLTDYSVRVDRAGQHAITVATISKLHCRHTVLNLPLQSAAKLASGLDQQSIADDFAVATGQMLRAVLDVARTAKASAACTASSIQ